MDTHKWIHGVPEKINPESAPPNEQAESKEKYRAG
jgi:hypothetical protein